MSRVASTRWCPTPEQVMILEEMYRGGIRTPNASQVQQITTHLSFFGEVEGKNVFYWFQNHKARDRQKLRRKLSRKERQYQTHDHSLHQIEPSSSAALQQLPLYNSTHFLPQREELKESPKQVMGCSWKVEISERDEMENSSRNYDHDWMMMVDMGSITPSCNRPLKTLQLFPITTTGLKDECTTSQQFSCSTSTN